MESTDVLQNQAGDELVFTTNDPTIKLFIIADGANQISNAGSATFSFSVSGGDVTLLVNGSSYSSSEVFYMNQEWNSDGEPHIAAIPPSQTTGSTELPNWDQPDGPALDSIPDPVVGETIFIVILGTYRRFISIAIGAHVDAVAVGLRLVTVIRTWIADVDAK